MKPFLALLLLGVLPATLACCAGRLRPMADCPRGLRVR
jgi:hypothetical protein